MTVGRLEQNVIAMPTAQITQLHARDQRRPRRSCIHPAAAAPTIKPIGAMALHTESHEEGMMWVPL